MSTLLQSISTTDALYEFQTKYMINNVMGKYNGLNQNFILSNAIVNAKIFTLNCFKHELNFLCIHLGISSFNN